MEELIRGKIKFFVSGFIAGGVPTGISLLRIPVIGASLSELVLAYLIRFVGAIVVALFTGLITVMVKDFYDIKIKNSYHRLLGKKKKKDEENGSEK